MRLRLATPDDRPAIAALHVASWKTAYRGLLPDDFLDGPMADELAAYWAETRPEAAFQIVAESGAQIVGFVGVTQKDGAYIEALHAAPEARGQGIGRALMRAVAEELAARGVAGVRLTVLVDNTGALAFYRRLGGVVGPVFDDVLCGVPIRSQDVTWPDLAPLRALF